MDKPCLVSILTPSFNQGRFLQDCLDSVSLQTYRPIEHIVMDGGSTDETLDILRNSPEHVRWLSESDKGQSDALNKAFLQSRGEIIGWVNSDDAYAVQEAVVCAVAEFSKHPEIDVLYGDALMIDASNRVLRHLGSSVPDWQHFLPSASPIVQPAAFLRRSALERLNVFLREDLAVTLDLELWLRLHRQGCVFKHVSMTLAADREHGERKVRTLEARWAEERKMLAKEYGIEFSFPRRVRMSRWLQRFRGVVPLLRLPAPHQRAIALHSDSLFALLVRQTMLPHSRVAVSA